MRPKERIPIFLKLVDFDKLEERWDTDIAGIIRGYICSPKGEVQEYWKENYDQRFGQVLINLQLLPDRMNIWMDEEDDILADQGVPFREYMLWGRSYDENRNSLPEIERILIKDMSTDHIKAILKDVETHRMNIRSDYLEAFRNEIELRKLN
jgi:hypothetical protein